MLKKLTKQGFLRNQPNKDAKEISETRICNEITKQGCLRNKTNKDF